MHRLSREIIRGARPAEASVTIQITKPEVEELIKERLESGRFKDAEDVILHALRSTANEPPQAKESREDAIERLRNFGRTHRLSLGGMPIQELRREARP